MLAGLYCQVRGERTRPITDIIHVVKKSGSIPTITNSGKMISTNHKIAILITMLKKPSVSNLKGKVIFFKIGLMKKLTKPKTKPQRKKILPDPSNDRPVTKRSASQKEIKAMMI